MLSLCWCYFGMYGYSCLYELATLNFILSISLILQNLDKLELKACDFQYLFSLLLILIGCVHIIDQRIFLYLDVNLCLYSSILWYCDANVYGGDIFVLSVLPKLHYFNDSYMFLWDCKHSDVIMSFHVLGIYYARLFLQLLHWQIGVVFSILWYTHLFLLLLLVFRIRTWVTGHSCSFLSCMVQVTGKKRTICNFFGSLWLIQYGRALFFSTSHCSPIRTVQLTYGAWAVYGQLQLLSL